MFRLRASRTLLAVGVTLAITSGGVAYATVVDTSNVIHGCYSSQAFHGSHVLVLQDGGTACPNGFTAIQWNEQGSPGLTGAAGPSGAPGAAGPSGATGPSGAAGPSGLAGPSGIAGPSGPAGPSGLAGPSGPAGPSGVTSINALNGSPCSIDGTAGTLALSFNASGLAALTCVIPTATPTPTPTPPDSNGHDCGGATNMGVLGTGQSATHSGTGPTPGVTDWFMVTSTRGTLTFTLTLTNESSVVFDVSTDCSSAPIDAGVTTATVPTAGTYYIKVYPTSGDGAGTFWLTAADQ